MLKPKTNEYKSFFAGYISLVSGDSFTKITRNHDKQICNYWENIPLEKWSYSYAPEKWTLIRVFQHIIDTERIMSYRALCIVRDDSNKLYEFDHNKYANSDNTKNRKINEMIKEWKWLRKCNNMMFQSFSENDLKKHTIIGEKKLSVRAIIYIIFGHALHHIKIINERYLNEN